MRYYLSLGANQGAVIDTLLHTRSALVDPPRSRLLAASSLYRTAPQSEIAQPDYINTALIIESAEAPESLLMRTQRLEQQAGRRPSKRNAPRPLDIDILLIQNEHHDYLHINHPALTVPHPRMTLRHFVLAPLAEIAPQLRLPDQSAIRERLAQVSDQRIHRLDEPRWQTIPLQESDAHHPHDHRAGNNTDSACGSLHLRGKS